MKTSFVSLVLLSVGRVASQQVENVDSVLDHQEAQAPISPKQRDSPEQPHASDDHLQAWNEVLKDYGTDKWDTRLAEFLKTLTHEEYDVWSRLHHKLLGDYLPLDESTTESTPRKDLK
ncbi:hypothetical protein G7Z17_g12934 [Cylindrodendrum hubeiense]|uniref:RxLR effector protein n=1 Tax=Cylindrodendrum hubeiense TaxID=595255 RepID=A0A9P5GT50_9HYPO|nr:hypothetical protein G7Z17_g12934 [Cylindrodendrum hubeiense]